MAVDRAQRLQWQVHGLALEALAWGPDDGRPVLALHGLRPGWHRLPG